MLGILVGGGGYCMLLFLSLTLVLLPLPLLHFLSLRTTEHFINEYELEQCIQNLKALRVDGLIVLGGTNAVSDAAILTEYLLNSDSQTCVVGVPMTVDNGMPFIEAVSLSSIYLS